ncbi:MAG: CinA family nicotinamide mononucleotide deamidase-related protein [Chloroflexota bacterium]
MTESINAEIVAIGTEILLGEITDTNSVYIARLLRDIGVNLYYMTSVGDNEQRIANAIKIACSRAQIVITCGGLGPTIDDMTRQGVAIATDRGLTFHQDLLDKIAERFAGFRAKMTENNQRQAYLPDNAIVIENPVGTAPSYIVEYGESVVISVPGVPREMKYLMTENVVPYLQEHFKLGKGIIKARVLRTAGIGESVLDSQIGIELLQAGNPTVGLAAHTGQVDVRITAKASDEAEADKMIAAVEAQLRAKLDRFIFGVDQETIGAVLINLLHETNTTIALSETGIGDPIGRALEAVEQGHTIWAKKQIVDSINTLRVSVSASETTPLRELAEQVSQMIAKTENTSAAIVVVSSPDDQDHADSEGGTAIAVYLDGKTRSRVFGFGGQTDIAADWVSTWSLSMLWQMVKEKFEAR